MSKSSLVRSSDVNDLLDTVMELEELPRRFAPRFNHVVSRLESLTGARLIATGMQAMEHGAPAGAVRPEAVVGALTAKQVALVMEYAADGSEKDPSVAAAAPRIASGERVFRRQDLVPEREWRRTRHYSELCRPLDIGPSAHLALPTRDGGDVLIVGINRALSDRAFSAREAALIGCLLPVLSRLLLLREREKAAALPGRYRPVLELLLKGESAKRIADELGLSVHTVREYIKHIYKIFGVRSAGELLAGQLGPGA